MDATENITCSTNARGNDIESKKITLPEQTDQSLHFYRP